MFIEFALSVLMLAMTTVQSPVPVTYDIIADGEIGISGAVIEFKIGDAIQMGVLGDFNCNGTRQFVDVIALNDDIIGIGQLNRCPDGNVEISLIGVSMPGYGIERVLEQTLSSITFTFTDLNNLIPEESGQVVLATIEMEAPLDSIISFQVESLLLDGNPPLGDPVTPIFEIGLIIN